MRAQYCIIWTNDTAGPLAVVPSLQGRGVGGLLLDYAESKADITELAIVNCRTDLLDFYQRRGYRFICEVPAENTIAEMEKLTRPGITLKYYQKQNKI